MIVAENSSERTKNNFQFLCDKKNTPCYTFGSIDELSKAIGKKNKAVIGIKDIHFAEEMEKKLNGGDTIG